MTKPVQPCTISLLIQGGVHFLHGKPFANCFVRKLFVLRKRILLRLGKRMVTSFWKGMIAEVKNQTRVKTPKRFSAPPAAMAYGPCRCGRLEQNPPTCTSTKVPLLSTGAASYSAHVYLSLEASASALHCTDKASSWRCWVLSCSYCTARVLHSSIMCW